MESKNSTKKTYENAFLVRFLSRDITNFDMPNQQKRCVFGYNKKQCLTWLATMALTMVAANENGQIKHSTNSNEICSSKSVCGFYWELS